MEVTKDMESLFVVNQELVNKVKDDKASNAVLDAVDDFCDQRNVRVNNLTSKRIRRNSLK